MTLQEKSVMNHHEPADMEIPLAYRGRTWNTPWIPLSVGHSALAFFVLITTVSGYASSVCAEPGKSPVGLTLLEAVKTTLSRQPGIRLENQSVQLNEGVLREENGLFDSIISVSAGQNHTDNPLPTGSKNSQGAITSHQLTDTSSIELSVNKTFRNGIIAKPSVSINRKDDGMLSDVVQNFATVSFGMTVPLLRGWGETATAGRELAARKAYAASLLQFRHTTARLVRETITSYWNYVAKVTRLEELKNSESRAEEFVRMIKTLVKSEERPGADLQQVVASFETKAALRITGEQEVQEAIQRLGLDIGLFFDEISRLPLPSDPLPVVPDGWDRNLTPAPMIEQALSLRSDYQAYKEIAAADLILLEKEKDNLLPALDLELSAGYSGLREGSGSARFIGSTVENVPGPSASAILKYKWPVGNNAAQGRILQKDATYRKDKIALEDLSRQIGSSIALALSTLKNSIAETGRIRNSILMYETALKNERKKVLLGSSTFLDLIVMEDRLQEAIQNEVSARFRYAESLARLHFETGMLLSGEGERAFVPIEDLTRLPQNFGEKENP